MAGHRLDRVNEEIKKELAVLLPTVKDPRVPTLLSVTAVMTTPDLKQAKVFVSSMTGDDAQTLAGLRRSAGYLRSALSHRLNLRYTPELVFHIDSSIKEGLKINQILTDIAKKDEEKQ